jgi:hypothetical protein
MYRQRQIVKACTKRDSVGLSAMFCAGNGKLASIRRRSGDVLPQRVAPEDEWRVAESPRLGGSLALPCAAVHFVRPYLRGEFDEAAASITRMTRTGGWRPVV